VTELALLIGVVLGLLLASLINTAPIAFARKAKVKTGRAGLCPDCRTRDACHADCPTLNPNSPRYNPYTDCVYVVDAKVGSLINFYLLCHKARVSVKHVNEMNCNRKPHSYWRVGNQISIPYGLCRLVSEEESPR